MQDERISGLVETPREMMKMLKVASIRLNILPKNRVDGKAWSAGHNGLIYVC